MPPSFPATHSWVCPLWSWLHARTMIPGSTIFDSAREENWATTTMVYVVNSRSAPISVHVDCYLSDGTLENGVRVAGDVPPRQRFQASLMPIRAPIIDARGNYRDRGEGWFQLWANGPVTPAAVFMTILAPMNPVWIVVPVEPVELEPAVAEAAPPLATTTPASEGVGGAAEDAVEANLSLDETVAWFESVRSGRPFERRRGNTSR